MILWLHVTWDVHENVTVTQNLVDMWPEEEKDEKTVRFVITLKGSNEQNGMIDVVIPFNRQGFNKTARRNDRKQPEKIRESIIDLLSSNGKISRKDLALLLNVTEGSIRHHLNKLQEEGLINILALIKADIGKSLND